MEGQFYDSRIWTSYEVMTKFEEGIKIWETRRCEISRCSFQRFERQSCNDFLFSRSFDFFYRIRLYTIN